MARRRVVTGAVVALTLLRLSMVNELQAQAEDAPVAAGRPRVECSESKHSFGRVIEGTLVEHDFALVNVGQAPLAVLRVVSSCGCTAAGAPDEPMLAGEEGRLHVVFDSSGFSGSVTKNVRVYTNDESRPYLGLTLEGEVLPEVSVVPAWVSFPEVVKSPDARSSDREVELRVAAGLELKLGPAKSLSPNVKVEEIGGDDNWRRLKVSISPEAPLGELRERISLELLGKPKGRSQVNIPVYAQVVPSLRLEPGILSFGLLTGSTEVAKTARLVSLTGKPVAVKGFRSSYGELDVSIRPEDDGRSHLISVRLDPRTLKDSLYAAVEFTTDRQGQESLALQVQAVLPAR